MLSGFTPPFTPRGLASLVPPPPWHYAGWLLSIELECDRDRAARFVPAQVGAATGRGTVHFADWQATTDGSELLDPVLAQYRETIVVLEIERPGGAAANFCPLIYVDQDVSMLRGLLQGWPKKMGSTWLTRSLPLDHPAAAPLRQGTRLGATLSVNGRRLVEARLELTGSSRRAARLRRPPDLADERVRRPHPAGAAAGAAPRAIARLRADRERLARGHRRARLPRRPARGARRSRPLPHDPRERGVARDHDRGRRRGGLTPAGSSHTRVRCRPVGTVTRGAAPRSAAPRPTGPRPSRRWLRTRPRAAGHGSETLVQPSESDSISSSHSGSPGDGVRIAVGSSSVGWPSPAVKKYLAFGVGSMTSVPTLRRSASNSSAGISVNPGSGMRVSVP